MYQCSVGFIQMRFSLALTLTARCIIYRLDLDLMSEFEFYLGPYKLS